MLIKIIIKYKIYTFNFKFTFLEKYNTRIIKTFINFKNLLLIINNVILVFIFIEIIIAIRLIVENTCNSCLISDVIKFHR